MAKRISELFGMDIYTAGGKFRGKVHDLIINLQEGRISTITTDSLSGKMRVSTAREAQDIIKSKSIDYSRVKSVGDVVIVADSGAIASLRNEEEEPATGRTTGAMGGRTLRLRRKI
ncbi:MAG: PRC-barrel domain-containing protein [Candidatus Diapherotrites archaeon]|nr:PRC-barrel domain-containing protein [Candidatus Diapherotrites archaeon]